MTPHAQVSRGQVRIFARQGDGFLPMGERSATSLGGDPSRVLFVPGARLLAVEFGNSRAVTIDPAGSQAPPEPIEAIPGDGDSTGEPVDELPLDLGGSPARSTSTRLMAGDREAVSLDIRRPNIDADDDGPYALPATGGTPKRVVDDPTVITWS